MGISSAVISGAAVQPSASNFVVIQAALGPNAANAIPRAPTDATTALALATKWYTYYFTRYQNDPATQQSGISYWQGQIATDGAPRAWANFAGSPQPVADGVEGLAEQLTPVIGNQYYAGTNAPLVAIPLAVTPMGNGPAPGNSPIPISQPSPVNPISGNSPSDNPTLPVSLPIANTPFGTAPAAAPPLAPAPAKVAVGAAAIPTPWYETPVGIVGILLVAFVVVKGAKHLGRRMK